MELSIKQALQHGIAAHKEGKLQEAEKLYRSILTVQPNHPDANHNLGVLAVGVGKVLEALPLFKLALESNPKQGQFWLSYIETLIKLGQLNDAKQVLQQGKISGWKGDQVDRLEVELSSVMNSSSTPIGDTNNPGKQQIDELVALYTQGKLQEVTAQGATLESQFPDNPIIPNLLGAAYSGLGQYEEAISNYNKAIKIKPDYAEAHNNLGIALDGLGQYQEAIASCSTAIEMKPDFNEAYNNLGNSLNELGKHEEATTNLKKAIILQPCYANAYNNLGNSHYEREENNGAITNYNKAIKIQQIFAEAHRNLGIVLASFKAEHFSETLASNYLQILNFKSLFMPTFIVESILILLKHHGTIKKAITCIKDNTLKNLFPEVCIQLSHVTLLMKIMEICPIPDLQMETLLTELRKLLLLEQKKVATNPDLLKFQSTLAIQCFTNEFIYRETKREKKAIQSLEINLQRACINNKKLSFHDIACLASYRPLHQYPWAIGLVYPPTMTKLVQRQITEINSEKKLQKNIPILNSIQNDISVRVQKQYEENPYPRWVNTALEIKPMTIKTFVRRIELLVKESTGLDSITPKILIAGCGTGQNSAHTASRFKNSHTTAIDLSLSSLAHAKRKSDELGIKNIHYMQADILDLKRLNREFDIIESSGVLHHMEDPVAGLEVLFDCLKPKGLMKISVYSELARCNIIRLRDIIKTKKIPPNRADIIEFRRQLIAVNDPAMDELQDSHDFYSTSMVRDLLFHIQEHRFTIPQISKILDALGLTFVGFEFQHNKIKKSFKIAYSQDKAIYDLDNWHQFETSNPTLFSGMYQFWTQKL